MWVLKRALPMPLPSTQVPDITYLSERRLSHGSVLSPGYPSISLDPKCKSRLERPLEAQANLINLFRQ